MRTAANPHKLETGNRILKEY